MITTWTKGTADDGMAQEILLELRSRVRRHPWWLERGALTLSLLERLGIEPPARVLDVGCGWGVTLELLEQSGYQATGLDISHAALDQLDSPGRQLVEADLTQAIPSGAPQFDAILALDVIEHLDDDAAALRQLASLVRPGGYAVVSVPALPDLYTEFDAVQGHRRRYLPETLRAAFQGSKLDVRQIFWWGQWLVRVVRQQRRKVASRPGESPASVYQRYLRLPPWPLPIVLRHLLARERKAALNSRLKCGTSLFAVARRLDDS
ncbi:MAG TPA: class I SAM-dependent methyltransferase [Pirellulales bacterium]|nr:class I SAM-dependent methyltransferase [Pirellulales bacterium]